MRKTFILISLLLTVMFSQKIIAQGELPKASTEENPLWYYCQLKKGTDTRKERIFYVDSNDLYGKTFSDITSNITRNRALFRFEKKGDSYVIYNKGYTNKQLSSRKDAAKNIDIATMVENSPQTWKIIPYKEGFQLLNSNNKYIYMAGKSPTLNYEVTVNEVGTSDNSVITFIPYDNTPPTVSEDKDIWYYIINRGIGYEKKCITDIEETGSGIVKFKLEDKSNDNFAQQWKVIKPINATNNNVHFVNRKTNNIIQTEYDFDGYFNAKSTDNIENSNGWVLTFLDLNQFSISGKDNQGITGYLNLSSNEEMFIPIPNKNEMLNSTYAWVFEEVLGESSIDGPEFADPFADIKVYVEDRRIIVEGTDNYNLTHISGIRISNDSYLSPGVYLITIQGKTKSILVK